MRWSHVLILVVAVVAGYWAGGKYPGLLTKLSGGVVKG